MKYRIDGWNNFCRVFQLPDDFPDKYCFSGGIPVAMVMVDWFRPVSELSIPAISKKKWISEFGQIETVERSYDELYNQIVPFVLGKKYVKKDSRYLIYFSFGAAMAFDTFD